MSSRRMRIAALTVLLASVATGALAQELKAEVIHWWTSGGESAAVKVFADQFAKAGGTWIDTAIAGGVNARTAAINRVVGGKPPTAMQFNTGKQFDELVENNMLADLDDVAAEGNWKKVVPPAFIDAVSRKGKIYAVPINIHGQNWLFYNRAVFEKAGVQAPATFDELLAALEKIKATGVVPLAFSGQKNWERLLFNTALVGTAGRDVFLTVYGKRDDALVRGPAFKQAAETFIKLKSYVDAGAAGRNWNDATAMVITGKAGMQFMGDWAKGEFISAGLTPGKEYGCTVVGQGYMMGGDVFAFARTSDAAQVRAQKTLAKVMFAPDTQIAFNAKKGSIPIRTDVDGSSLDVCAQAGMKMVADPARQVPDINLVAEPALVGALDDVISEFWNAPSPRVDAFIAKFAQTLKSAL
ncbi:MAG: carbohydrate ABC transporter substrate-binding protein [Alphaproteobacteria bacterium]|nr:carbohydrate ABC transporter substrate-binding protein [Alphaproteobacteria bacterium]